MGFLAGALLLTASGQLAFKFGVANHRRPVTGMGLIALGAAMVCTLFALRTLGIGLVYLSTGLTHVLILAGSRFILHERIPLNRLVGAAAIIAGVGLYASAL
jgi:drug/metabolite transporter (DMT)-like permease